MAEWIYDLYDIIRSHVIRPYIKPRYEYLLYEVLTWWYECNDFECNLIPNELNESLVQKIKETETYILEDGTNYVFDVITNFEEYCNILFVDYDFLPEILESLLMLYLKSRKMFQVFFADVDLSEYRELMPKDLQEQYDEIQSKIKNNETEDNEDIFSDDKVEKTFFEYIIWCCERIQADFHYKNAKEDERNDLMRNMLSVAFKDKCFSVRDQTRQGTSSGGKEAGEVDLLLEKDKMPISIIEALNLTQVSKSYIAKHIDKIYTYDTAGYNFNYMVSYVKTKDFDEFWKRYREYIDNYDYPYKLKNIEEVSLDYYSEIKVVKMDLERAGRITKLYHIAVHMTE